MKNRLLPLFFLALALPAMAQSWRGDSADLRLVVAAGLTPVAPYHSHEFIVVGALSTYRLGVVRPDGSLDEQRAARFVKTLQWQYGLARTNRLSAGLDLYYSRLRLDPDEGGSPFAVFSGNDPAGGLAVGAVSAIGPKVRFTPFARHYELTLQASALFPVAKRDYRTLLDEDRVRLALQASYVTPLPARFYVYAGADVQVKPANDLRNQTTWFTPLNFFIFNKLLQNDPQSLFLFAGIAYNPAFEKEYKGGLRRVGAATTWNAGVQYGFSPAWSASLSWQGLLGIQGASALDRNSYWGLQLGLRYAGAF